MSLADKRRPALGRGMAALLSNAASPPTATPAAAPGRALLQLPIEAVERSKEQPRKRFDERQLEELAASIRTHGVVAEHAQVLPELDQHVVHHECRLHQRLPPGPRLVLRRVSLRQMPVRLQIVDVPPTRCRDSRLCPAAAGPRPCGAVAVRGHFMRAFHLAHALRGR